MAKYDFQKTEKKWQKAWQKERAYEPDLKSPSASQRKPFYNLMMFPYPSAEGLHVGNMYAFTGSDVYGRFKRMQGYDVFEPIGLDGFGIHSENYALKIGAHPMKRADISEKRFYKQLEMLGNGFAWDERLETYDPDYYKWTQWIFVRMFKNGLAYRKKQPVNWCPSCKTVLADEQVIAGKCERCSSVVIKKELEQWFFRITKYSERLLKNLETIDWSERVKIAQRNWIGKSEGAEIDFEVKTKDKPNFILLHGYEGSPSRNFFPWLKKELEKKGYAVQTPALPDSNDPKVAEQVAYVLKHTKFNENTILLGHSLGGVVAMKILERLKKPIRKTVLVASFTKNTFITEPFEQYAFDWRFDAKKIKRNAGTVEILRDTTDNSVPQYQAEKVKQLIGGAIFDFAANKPHSTDKIEPEVLKHCVDKIGVFTTRPDTLFGATYMVLAPEHPLVQNIESGIQNLAEVKEYIKKAKAKSEEERIAEEKEKTGVELKGIKAINPATKEEIPVWVADYVLTGYGTGAIMAVPAHDERDWEFAKKYNLPIKMVVCPHYPAKTCPVLDTAYEGEGHLVDSGKFNGIPSEVAKWEITKFAGGEKKIQYRLRDWLISRQRYWGPPIPMVFCDSCAKKGKGEHPEMPGWYAAPEKDLPVRLPFVKDFRPKGKGESPLGTVKSFYETKCPKCGSRARRETDVSDTFLDSAWYYLRYPSVREKNHPWNPATTKKWLPVDTYIGGAEHSVLHLLYSRFLTMALHDIGVLHFSAKGGSASGGEEPFKKFRAHGLLIKEGSKMSKSKGNVVNPDEYIKKFGADTLRMYLMFLAPFEQGGDFRDSGILGVKRFLERTWRLCSRAGSSKTDGKNGNAEKALHKTIKKVTEDIEELHYNTAISALMILLNEFEAGPGLVSRGDVSEFVKLLAPFAPHLAEELWRGVLGNKNSIHREPWPAYDPKLIVETTFTLVIQVNGKVRDSVEAPAGIGKQDAETLALNREKIKDILGTAKPAKVFYVQNRLINIVAGT